MQGLRPGRQNNDLEKTWRLHRAESPSAYPEVSVDDNTTMGETLLFIILLNEIRHSAILLINRHLNPLLVNQNSRLNRHFGG
jgi:hypothetical protein